MDIQAYKNEVQSHVDRGNFHAAINIAISGVNECRREHDQTGIDTCLDTCRQVIHQFAAEFGSSDYLKQLDT